MQFMIRIELHGVQHDDATYERLHNAADAKNLSRTLTDAATGEQYRAPTGTYWTEAYSNWHEVMSAAKIAALAVHPDFEVMVSGGDEPIHFFNCRPLQPLRRLGALLAAARGTAPTSVPPAPKRLPSVFARIGSTVPVPHGLPTLSDLGRSLTPSTATVPVPLPTLSPFEQFYEALKKT